MIDIVMIQGVFTSRKLTKNMHSVQNSNTFLGRYNKIDKVLAYAIESDKYIPFNEKVAIIAQSNMPISRFVRLYQNKLRYFWDLRNQLVHWFSLEKKHYIVASDYAVEQIEFVYNELTQPRTIWSLFTKNVYSCVLSDSLKEVITIMKEKLNTHVPVYDDNNTFVEMLSESTIAYRIAQQISESGELHIENVLVSDVPLENSNDTFTFVSKDKSIYEIQELFATSFMRHKRLWAVFITETGSSSEPLVWIITAMDLPTIAKTLILE